jgi:sporulation protein YlmC with PRC-barrel domain
MIRKLLATTAVATLISTGAMAQTTVPAQPAQPGATVQDPAARNPAAAETRMVTAEEGNLASNIIGETVYNSTADDAESIGEVNDIVIGANGGIEALVIGVGGFLGIGEKDVAIEYDLAEWVERDGDRWIVVPTTADALKAQPEFDRLAYQPMPEGTQVGQTKPASKEDLAKAPVEGEANDDMAAAPADGTAVAPATDGQATTAAPMANDEANQDTAAGTDQTRTSAIDRSTLQPMAAEELTAENVIGSTVYGANEENVGEVGDLVLSQDGKIDAVILDVGGFLGIGEKEVAIGMDNLEFMLDENGNRYLYTPFTQEQLEAQPAYDESAYAEARDDMRMVVPN